MQLSLHLLQISCSIYTLQLENFDVKLSATGDIHKDTSL